MTPTEQITDADIAREMAEADVTPDMAKEWGSMEKACAAVLDHDGYPPESLDAAAAWLERRGFRWIRLLNADVVQVTNGVGWYSCAESPTCSTARAMCNAGVAAWRAMGQGKEAQT